MLAELEQKTVKSNFWPLVGEGALLPMHRYTKKVIAFSGGKDSLALLLMLLESGVPREEIELWHHLVDGAPGTEGNFDWPITEDYVRAVGQALGVPVRFSWKDGGFEREMFRHNQQTSGVYYEDGDRRVRYLPPQKPTARCKECGSYFCEDTESHCEMCGTVRGGFSTRLKYPMKTADLSKRWCSAYLKIMVCRRIISNDPRFETGNLLLLSGERRQESDARNLYDEVAVHPCSNKSRRVDQWRGVIDWKETDVWAALERWRVRPHPCYYLGFSRCSCMTCIFGDKHQWATVEKIAPRQFAWHAANERRFGLTIAEGESVVQQARRGRSTAEGAPKWVTDLAMSTKYPRDLVIVPKGEEWELPSGAYKRGCGPT